MRDRIINKICQRSVLLKAIDYAIVCSLLLLIVLNVAKAYIFINPKEGVPLLYFWDRGSVKRQFSQYLVTLTNISYIIFGLCSAAIFSELFVEIPLVSKKELAIESFLAKKSIQLCMIFITWVILLKSWGGTIP